MACYRGFRFITGPYIVWIVDKKTSSYITEKTEKKAYPSWRCDNIWDY